MRTRSRITIAQTQRLSLNLSLSAAIQVLKFSAASLSSWLEEQAAANPQLHLTPPPALPAPWLPRWHDALSRQSTLPGGMATVATPGLGLISHVTGAVAALDLSAGDQPLALALVEALEPSGWLGRSLAAIARETGAPPARLEALLLRLQGIEPVGIFARDLAECLRLQAAEAEELDPIMAQVLAHLPLVAAGDLAALATKADCEPSEIALRIRRLRRYDPKPGARFQPGTAPVTEPDLLLRSGPGGPELSLNRSSLPSVTLAPDAGTDHDAPAQAGRSEAQKIIRLVERRNSTLLRVGAEILRRQPMIATQGLGALVPMTMGEVAGALGLHQSTVSRIVQGTSVDTGAGTFWLRAMFSLAVRPDGPAGAAMRDAMAQMIAAEDPAAPLDDAGLARALAGAGAPIARRTVAKYRMELGIPTAAGRKRAAKLSSATRKPG